MHQEAGVNKMKFKFSRYWNKLIYTFLHLFARMLWDITKKNIKRKRCDKSFACYNVLDKDLEEILTYTPKRSK